MKIFFLWIVASDIGLDAQNRFDTGRFRRFIKLNRAIEIAMVGECECSHTQLLSAIYKFINFSEAVEKGIMRMGVEMHKVLHCSLILIQYPNDKQEKRPFRAFAVRLRRN